MMTPRERQAMRASRAAALILALGAFLVGAVVAYVLTAIGLRGALLVGLVAFLVSYVIGVWIWLRL